MGQDITQTHFTANDYATFQQKLFEQVECLKSICRQPDFGNEPLKIGAELELYLIDKKGHASLSNQRLLDQINDPQMQHELNQYNLEINLSAFNLLDNPLTALQQEIDEKTALLQEQAQTINIDILPIGILPTLTKELLTTKCMTNVPRYHTMAQYFSEQRGEDFHVNVKGDESLSVNFSDICAEGANTSFQVHLMTTPELLVNTFNAAQLTLPLITAIGANSPIFLQQRLWDETRIALFKQSLDIRQHNEFQWKVPTRVNFGHGWLRKSIDEFFIEAVSLYPPVLPVIYDEDHTDQHLPKFKELSLHLGTIWPWHRPVYSSEGNGHIRIEFRAIPAGPSHIDMIANAALAIGLASGLADNIDDYIAKIPFNFAEYNFYRAAQHGLNAKILWPLNNAFQPKETAITDVLRSLLPVALIGLTKIGISHKEASFYLSLIEKRLDKQITGAIWQKNTMAHLEKSMNKQQASEQLVKNYLAHYQTGKSIIEWESIWS
ncbi:hypothetical protein [Thalassotalea ganghwensis]